mmetsp:Transcript_69727/g.149177  ORF Transcript_69727/g.149177 Transcript_69727/m.149177 type:complete len:196 (-) Transcript_69727:52-639(-)
MGSSSSSSVVADAIRKPPAGALAKLEYDQRNLLVTGPRSFSLRLKETRRTLFKLRSDGTRANLVGVGNLGLAGPIESTSCSLGKTAASGEPLPALAFGAEEEVELSSCSVVVDETDAAFGEPLHSLAFAKSRSRIASQSFGSCTSTSAESLPVTELVVHMADADVILLLHPPLVLHPWAGVMRPPLTTTKAAMAK